MNYSTLLLSNKEAAASELEKHLARIVPPPIYAPWDDVVQYQAIPDRIRLAFDGLVTDLINGNKDGKPGLTILGDPGVGKTMAIYALSRHLLTSAWVGRFQMKYVPKIIEHIEWVQIVRKVTRYGESDADRSAAKAEIEECMNFPGFLFLDDIGVAAMPDFVAEAFYQLVDTRLKNWRPTIFVSNATTQELADNLDPRVSHRILRWTNVMKFEK